MNPKLLLGEAFTLMEIHFISHSDGWATREDDIFSSMKTASPYNFFVRHATRLRACQTANIVPPTPHRRPLPRSKTIAIDLVIILFSMQEPTIQIDSFPISLNAKSLTFYYVLVGAPKFA